MRRHAAFVVAEADCRGQSRSEASPLKGSKPFLCNRIGAAALEELDAVMIVLNTETFGWRPIAGLLAMLALAACGQQNAYVSPPPPKVVVAKPLQQPVTRYIELTEPAPATGPQQGTAF